MPFTDGADDIERAHLEFKNAEFSKLSPIVWVPVINDRRLTASSALPAT